MEASKIFIFQVSRVDQDSEKGYQRVLSEREPRSSLNILMTETLYLVQ